jgi:hypothetical protein
MMERMNNSRAMVFWERSEVRALDDDARARVTGGEQIAPIWVRSSTASAISQNGRENRHIDARDGTLPA